ncbi:hypothetical protein [Catellatospora methionotrophica]|uniref:hypothetical protein n=1 Tax=Catellatospora methionotrophica TaxID=121620 RepID=UPI0033E4BB3D
MEISFTTRQELAAARAACKRMLAAYLQLTTAQFDALRATLAILESFDSTGPAAATLTPVQQVALVSALNRQVRHAGGDSVVKQLLAKLPPVASWPLPNPEVVQFVRLGFGDHHRLAVRSLSFAVAMPDLPTLETCLRESIGSCNNLDGSQAASAIAALWNDLSTIMLGRDDSPFIEIHIPYTRQQRNGGDNALAIRLEPGERDAVIDAAIAVGSACQADSILFKAPGRNLSHIRPGTADLAAVRLWWD